MSVAEHVTKIEEELDGLRAQERTLLKSVENLQKIEIDAAEKANRSKEDEQKQLLSYNKTIRGIKTSMDEAETELQIVKEQVLGLGGKRADLLIENGRLRDENIKFREYEGKAMKILKNQEESLIKREEIIQQKEQLTGGNKSFLPSVN